MFIIKVLLLTTTCETGFQSIFLAIHHWELNPGPGLSLAFYDSVNAKGNGFMWMNLYNLSQRLRFMEDKLGCVYVKITVVLFIFSF